MKRISTFAIAAALVVGGAIVTAPVRKAEAAQKKEEAARKLTIGKAARPALKALETAVKAKDAAGVAAALPAAEAAATTPDEKYFVARQRYQHARDINDVAAQSAALNAIIASGAANAGELSSAHFNVGVAAYQASNWQQAHDSFTKVVELSPNDSDALFNLALAKMKLKKDAEASTTLNQAIAAAKAAGKPVPEAWMSTALQISFQARKPEALALSREILQLYPTKQNWRNALVVYLDSVKRDRAASIDVLRLMRASKAMTTRNEYYELALALSEATPALPAEAKKVIDEAVAANLNPPARTTDTSYRTVNSFAVPKLAEDQASLPGLETRAMAAATGKLAFNTADALLGYGEYARAAALYRAALSKGGDVDIPLANSRLGIALALAGDKAGAETAFKAVTGAGPRAEVAALWLAWLANPIAG